MLIQFKVENYRSFRDEQTFNLVASRDPSHPGNLIRCDGFSVAKAAAVYGPNASGKSNLIKAISAMERFVLTSATNMNLGDRIDVSPFRLDPQMRTRPSRFEVTVLVDGVTYVYGFSATAEQVHDEWLDVRRRGGRLSPWLRRTFDPLAEKTDWEFRGPIKAEAELLQARTRNNGLLLSRAAELNVAPMAPLFLWFRKRLMILDLSSPPVQVAFETARRIRTNDVLRSHIAQLIKDADFGITGIEVAEEPVLPDEPETTLADTPESLREFITSLYAGLRKFAGDKGFVKLSVATEHLLHPSAEVVRFSLENDESNGTQRFFALAGPILDAIANGRVLVIDELDCSMHPHLTRKLIELFQNSEMNTSGAQLVFATHDSSMMDSSLFRRDQIWLTEKRRNGSTDLFSLYDIDSTKRPRAAEALEKNYLAGRYGGVPKFGPALEDLEVR